MYVQTNQATGTYLAQPGEEPSHGGVVERLITVKHKHETTKLRTQSLDRLRLTGPRRTERVTTHSKMQRLGQR